MATTAGELCLQIVSCVVTRATPRLLHRPIFPSTSLANTSQEAAISAGSSSRPTALAAILIPSPARFANCDLSSSRASSATGRALSSLRSRCMRLARSSVVVPRRSRRTSSASLSVDRAVPERSRILCTLATSNAAEPATRMSNIRSSEESRAATLMTSESTTIPSSPRTIRAERASCPSSLAARRPLPGLIEAGTSKSMATSVVGFALVGGRVTHTLTLSPPLGRKPACVNACSRGGTSPSVAGSMARSPSVVYGATGRSSSPTRM